MLKDKGGFIFLIVIAIAIVASIGSIIYVSVNNGPKPITNLNGITLEKGFEFVSELSNGNYLVKSDDGSYKIVQAKLEGGYNTIKEISPSQDLSSALQEFFNIEPTEEGSKVPSCGNAVLEDGEECDIGLESLCNNKEGSNTWSGSNQKRVCRIDVQNNECSCVSQQTCGDGEYDKEKEECDESAPAGGGNICKDPKFCLSCECQTPPICGNKIVEFGEQCDDGNTANDDGCNSNCMEEFCGDGIRNNMEQCDDGNKDNNDLCTSDCIPTFCGDGFLNPNEQCDDGNNAGGDGCSGICITEIKYTCAPISNSPVITGVPFQCGGTCPPDKFCSRAPGNACRCVLKPEALVYLQSLCFDDCLCENDSNCLVNSEELTCFCMDGLNPTYT